MLTRHFSRGFLILVVGSWLTAAEPPPFKPSRPDDSLVRYLTKHGLQKSSEPYLLASEVFTKLEPRQRRGLVKQILRGVLSNVPPSAIADLLQSSFGWKPAEAKTLVALAKADGAALDGVVEVLFETLKLDRNPTLLDTFPTIPLTQMPKLQQALFSMGKYHPDAKDPVPFPLGYPMIPDWAKVELKLKGCKVPAADKIPVFREYGIYQGQEPVEAQTVRCYADNSLKLSRLLNGLTNTLVGQKVDGSLDLTGSKAGKQAVTSFKDFTEALDKLGLTVEVYNSRVLVDFLGWWYLDGKTYKSIRVPTWILVKLGEQMIRVPAEHGEFDFIVRDSDGHQLAGLRWYFGIPTADYPGMATFWRPHLDRQSSWSDELHEFVDVLPPGKNAGLLPYLDASAHVMRGFQAINDRYEPPANSYGLYVCSDSMVFGLAKLAELREEKKDERLSNAFPTLYSTVLYRREKDRWIRVRLDQIFSRYSTVKLETLHARAPTDMELEAEPEAMKERLKASFRPEDDHRLEPFRDFKDDGLKVIRAR